MSPTAKLRIRAWAAAAVAATGLLAFGWSPTALLLLYWAETAVLVLGPLLYVLVALGAVPGPTPVGERLTGIAIFAFLLAILGTFVVFHGAMILFLDGAARADELGLPPGHLPGLVPELSLAPLLRDPLFVAGLVTVVGLVIADLRSQSRAPAESPWISTVGTRLLLMQAALLIGGAVLLLTGLPSAAALLLVAAKLAFDLRRARTARPPPPATAASTAHASDAT